MSMDIGSEHFCYVHCNFCNTILAVSVPCTSLFTIVTVRCGHCANLLSVNMGALLQTVLLQDPQKQLLSSEDSSKDSGGSSSSKSDKFPAFESGEIEEPIISPIRRASPLSLVQITQAHGAPEKRQRVPSAYNRFIKEEIQRIKATNPGISHREAFSTAAKNWAHFPHIQFGLKQDGNNKAKMDQ